MKSSDNLFVVNEPRDLRIKTKKTQIVASSQNNEPNKYYGVGDSIAVALISGILILCVIITVTLIICVVGILIDTYIISTPQIISASDINSFSLWFYSGNKAIIHLKSSISNAVPLWLIAIIFAIIGGNKKYNLKFLSVMSGIMIAILTLAALISPGI